MKPIVTFFAFLAAFFSFQPTFCQTTGGSIIFNENDIDGNNHDIQAYLDAGKTVFYFIFYEGSPNSWPIYQSYDLNSFYNTFGQGGNNDAVVLMLAYGYETASELSGIDFSAELGPEFSDLSFTENNDLPIILFPNEFDPFDLGGRLGFVCPSGSMGSVDPGSPESYMEGSFGTCCTSLESFDPALQAIMETPNCENGTLNFYLNNSSPTPFSAILIDVIINGVFEETFQINQTISGCGWSEQSYFNPDIAGGDQVKLAIQEDNDSQVNDTAFFDVQGYTEIYGHLRIRAINSTEGAYFIGIGSANLDPLSSASLGNFSTVAPGIYDADIILQTGCQQLTSFYASGGGWFEDPTFYLFALDENGLVVDTLLNSETNYWSSPGISVFVSEAGIPLVSGHVFEDVNNLQNYNPSLPGIPGIEVTHGTFSTFTDSAGYYELPYSEGSSISISYDTEVWSVITTQNPDTNIFQVSNHDFGLNTNMPFWELTPTGFSFTPYLCWTGVGQNFFVHNTGNQPTSGELTVTHDPVLTVESYNPTPIAVSGNQATFSIEDLGFNQYFYVSIDYMNDTTGLIGEVIETNLEVTTFNDDNNIVGTSAIALVDTFFCAYDPNDIFGYPLGSGSLGKVPADTPLDYRIRFQNTGNYPATTVVVVDTLPENLVWESFSPGPCSHPCTVALNADTREIRWTFDNIQLPDSTTDLEDSNGYLWYEVDMVPGLAIGEEITNTAYIYFDLNPAIVTNTSLHTIQGPLGTRSLSANNQFDIFPNPVASELTIRSNSSLSGILRLMDIRGRQVTSQRFNGGLTTIDMKAFPAGVYILQIEDGISGAIWAEKVVKVF